MTEMIELIMEESGQDGALSPTRPTAGVAEGGSVCRPHTQPRLASCPQSGGRLKSPRSRRSDNLKMEQKHNRRTDLSRQTQATGT